MEQIQRETQPVTIISFYKRKLQLSPSDEKTTS